MTTARSYLTGDLEKTQWQVVLEYQLSVNRYAPYEPVTHDYIAELTSEPREWLNARGAKYYMEAVTSPYLDWSNPVKPKILRCTFIFDEIVGYPLLMVDTKAREHAALFRMFWEGEQE